MFGCWTPAGRPRPLARVYTPLSVPASTARSSLLKRPGQARAVGAMRDLPPDVVCRITNTYVTLCDFANLAPASRWGLQVMQSPQTWHGRSLDFSGLRLTDAQLLKFLHAHRAAFAALKFVVGESWQLPLLNVLNTPLRLRWRWSSGLATRLPLQLSGAERLGSAWLVSSDLVPGHPAALHTRLLWTGTCTSIDIGIVSHDALFDLPLRRRLRGARRFHGFEAHCSLGLRPAAAASSLWTLNDVPLPVRRWGSRQDYSAAVRRESDRKSSVEVGLRWDVDKIEVFLGQSLVEMLHLTPADTHQIITSRRRMHLFLRAIFPPDDFEATLAGATAMPMAVDIRRLWGVACVLCEARVGQGETGAMATCHACWRPFCEDHGATRRLDGEPICNDCLQRHIHQEAARA